SRSRARATVGFVIGVLLLVAAAWAVSRHQAEFREAMDAARRARWWLVTLAVVLPLGNWLLMALSVWILMRRHGRVALGEMTCLIGAAWLLNYLPFRPGLFGRVAYHKAVNGIPIVKSIGATISAIVCSGLAIMVLLGVALIVRGRGTGALISG